MSACLCLLGVSSPFSAPRRLSKSAAVADWGRLLFVQSCSTPSVGTWEWCYISAEAKQTGVVIEEARVTSLCATSLCSCVCCFYSTDMCLCVWLMVVVDGTGVTFLSHHTTLCVCFLCVYVNDWKKGMSGTTYSPEHPGAVCVHLTLCMYETVFDL